MPMARVFDHTNTLVSLSAGASPNIPRHGKSSVGKSPVSQNESRVLTADAMADLVTKMRKKIVHIS